MPPSHELGILARQKRHHTCHIIRAAKMSQRSILLKLRQILFTPPILVARSLDDGRMNRINANAVLAQLLRRSERNTAQCEFRAGVGYQTGEAAEAGDAGAQDDGAAVVLIAHGDGDVFDAEECCVQDFISTNCRGRKAGWENYVSYQTLYS
jgi:hypothetical protein